MDFGVAEASTDAGHAGEQAANVACIPCAGPSVPRSEARSRTGGTQVRFLSVRPNEKALEDNHSSLSADSSILAAFPESLTASAPVPDHQAISCAACHAKAFQSWSSSRHAHARGSLTAKNRVVACITCHTSQQNPGQARAQGVSCVACHVGADAHADGGGLVSTSRVVDCRSCHDSAHHPEFNPALAWEVIRH
jgi:Cytochrome c554 and c-prime